MVTNQVNMVIVVMTFCAIIFTERIFDQIICTGNAVDNSFFHESLQGAVNGHPIELIPSLFVDISVRERFVIAQEHLQDLQATFSNAQVIFLQ